MKWKQTTGEIMGWVLTGIGLYFSLFKEITVFHILILIMGIALIFINFPFKKTHKK
jgi:membrane-bound ClpP family serine protease